MDTQTSFRYSHTVGFYSNQGRGFNSPYDLALAPNGVMYVINRGGPNERARLFYKRISMCTVDEEWIGEFSTGGRGNGELLWPVSIALDGDGNVFVADEALQRISIFDGKGRYLDKWGNKGSGEGEFDRPAGIAFDKEGDLLVVDGLNNRVQKFTGDGRFLSSWGRRGSGEGQLNMPWGIHIDEAGDVYIADWRNDRIQKFDADGRPLASWGSPGDGQFCRPAGLTVDDSGNLYVADWGNERVQVITQEGEVVAKFRGDGTVSKWGQDYFISNMDELEERQNADLEPEIDPLPEDNLREESSSIEKLFWGPTSIKIDGDGRILIVDSCRHRIQVYLKESRVPTTARP